MKIWMYIAFYVAIICAAFLANAEKYEIRILKKHWYLIVFWPITIFLNIYEGIKCFKEVICRR